MNGPQALERVLDEWYRWVSWIDADNRDDTKSGEMTGYEDFMYLVKDDPEIGWKAIPEAIHQPHMRPYLGNLAASPLEELLDLHGATFIE